MEQRYNKLNNINIDTNDDGIDNKLALSPISNKISVSILLTIINTLMSVSILVLVVYNVMPFINNIDQVNLSELQVFINQANNNTAAINVVIFASKAFFRFVICHIFTLLAAGTIDIITGKLRAK